MGFIFLGFQSNSEKYWIKKDQGDLEQPGQGLFKGFN